MYLRAAEKVLCAILVTFTKVVPLTVKILMCVCCKSNVVLMFCRVD